MRRLSEPPLAMVLVIAFVWTFLNAIKPVHIDDAYFLSVARHISQHPTDPFGFQSFWYEWPEPGFWVVCPMVLPYWLALPAALFWDTPFIIKMWMLPFAIAFVWSVRAMLRRFVGRHVTLLLVAIVFSPAFLPSINAMLDIPALGLALLALELFIRSTEKRSILTLVLSGMTAGVAIQTKYSVLALPLLILLYGCLFKQLPRAILACFIASAIFWGWEGLLALKYGQSHFVAQMQLDDPISTIPKLQTWVRLPGYVSGGMPMLAFIALVLFRWRMRALGTVLIVLPVLYYGIGEPSLSRIFFAGLTVIIFASIAHVLLQRWRTRAVEACSEKIEPGIDRTTGFLVAWLALEIFISMASSLFAGERRVFGVIIVCTLLICRLCFFTQRFNPSPRFLRCAVGVSIAIAALMYAIDLDEATTWRDAAYNAVAKVREMEPDANIWYVGHWGIDHYMPKLGAKPLVPDNSKVKKNDWILVFVGAHRQTMLMPPKSFDADMVPANFYWPWSMTSSFHGGDAPIAWRSARTYVLMLRAQLDMSIPSDYANNNIIEIIEHRRKFTPDAALPAVITKLRQCSGEELVRARRAIERIGPRALIYTLQHAEPENRAWAAARLGDHPEIDSKVLSALTTAQNDPAESVRSAVTESLGKLRSHSRK